MSKIGDIRDQINDLTTFKHISSAFIEAAAVKLRNIRSAFERNDRFYENMIYIYHLVEMNAGKEKIANVVKGDTSANKLTVALTSNQRFFGTLNNEIMSSVLNFCDKNNTSLLVMGNTGINYLRAINYNKTFQTMTLE